MARRERRRGEPRPPIIVMGMHRSGTTLVTKMLEDLGVFVGLRGGSNREAFAFSRVNKWMFAQARATWDRPENAAFMARDRPQAHLEEVLRRQVRGLSAVRYLGATAALGYRDLRRLDFPWAWKDPRNSFTAKLWKRVFPAARIVHVYRHPVDVAHSLLRREEERLDRFERSLRVTISEELLLPGPLYCHSFRLLDPREGVDLWQRYVEASFDSCALFEKDVVHCRFESLLERPEQVLGELAEFLELDCDADRVARVTEQVDPARSLAYLADPAMASLAEEISHRPLVAELGYQAPAATERTMGGT